LKSEDQAFIWAKMESHPAFADRSNDRFAYDGLANWLFAVAAMVFMIVIVGGITRLTESGLSITEWKPLLGTIPPLTDAQWVAEFEKYKQIPEYIEINGPAGMTLAEFKFIYFWEWVHRLLGRVIGLALALPFLWLAIRQKLPKGYTLRIFALVMLVGLQGAIGWWMVASGLETRTDVSHFRLAAHLLTALVILLQLSGSGCFICAAPFGRVGCGPECRLCFQQLAVDE
jgi:heme a synthase